MPLDVTTHRGALPGDLSPPQRKEASRTLSHREYNTLVQLCKHFFRMEVGKIFVLQ